MQIAIVSASVRNGRLSHRAALGLHKLLDQQPGIESFIVDLRELPNELWDETFVTQDERHKTFKNLKAALDESDAMIFLSPEYNGAYTSALKNMVDFYPKSTFSGKAIGVASVTTGRLGGMRAALQMQQLVLAVFAYPQPNMLLVPLVDKMFNEQGDLLDPKFKKIVEQFTEEFVWFAETLSNARVKAEMI